MPLPEKEDGDDSADALAEHRRDCRAGNAQAETHDEKGVEYHVRGAGSQRDVETHAGTLRRNQKGLEEVLEHEGNREGNADGAVDDAVVKQLLRGAKTD